MKGRVGAGLLSCAFVLSALPGPVRAGDEPSGAVYVTTLPSGADVWIDGTYVGRAPVLVDALLPGHHALTLTKTGWAVQEVDVAIEGSAIALSTTRLAATRASASGAAGSLVVLGAPAATALTLDGEPFGGAPGRSVPLPPGVHRITMTTARGRTTRAFNILPQTTTDVVLRESPAAGTPAAVVAPAEDYLPTDAFTMAGKKIVVRYGGHVVVAHLGEVAVRIDGAAVTFDSAPQLVGGKLYMPLRLLEKLSDDTSKSP